MKVEEYWYDTNQLLILKLNLIAVLLCGSTKMGSDIQLDLYPMYNVQGLIINIGNNTSFRLFWIHKRLVTLVTSERASWETEVRDGTEINFSFDILFSVKNNKPPSQIKAVITIISSCQTHKNFPCMNCYTKLKFKCFIPRSLDKASFLLQKPHLLKPFKSIIHVNKHLKDPKYTSKAFSTGQMFKDNATAQCRRHSYVCDLCGSLTWRAKASE